MNKSKPFLHNCPAPAKLNLFLHVTGQRPDGYHLLQSVFQLIDLCDTLHFDCRDDSQIRRLTDNNLIPEEDDLVIRAARLLQKAASIKNPGFSYGVDIRIEKSIPMGGGLGGGSSDAATTLLVLNRLWNCDFTKEELMSLSVQLGADVPFFIFGENAYAEGIGEKLSCRDTRRILRCRQTTRFRSDSGNISRQRIDKKHRTHQNSGLSRYL